MHVAKRDARKIKDHGLKKINCLTVMCTQFSQSESCSDSLCIRSVKIKTLYHQSATVPS